MIVVVFCRGGMAAVCNIERTMSLLTILVGVIDAVVAPFALAGVCHLWGS